MEAPGGGGGLQTPYVVDALRQAPGGLTWRGRGAQPDYEPTYF